MQYLALLVGRDDDPEAAPGSAEFDAEVQRYAEFEERVTAAIMRRRGPVSVQYGGERHP